MKHDHIDDTNERLAREFYDAYCSAVGGKAFNGDPLPPASEFFEDEAKSKQANAYRAAVAAIVPPASYAMEADPREPEDDLTTGEVIPTPVVIGADYEPPVIIGGGVGTTDAIDPDADLDDPLPPRTCGDGEACESCT